MRGEQQDRCAPGHERQGSPPHARGAVFHVPVEPSVVGITPACAGSSVGVRIDVRYSRDHPRMRGEQYCFFCCIRNKKGSPPHARGAASVRLLRIGFRGITPACAGSRAAAACPGRPGWDHPRMRGEQSLFRLMGISRVGSPPHARGAVLPPLVILLMTGITPACAGSSRLRCYKYR